MKVIIIDDEPHVREGLKMIIPWKAHGFDICGEGIDGIDGLQKIMLLSPELVLIDIRMPGMTGIEVIEEAQKRGFQGKFIITTGYSDFEYARKAIRLGVRSYVLKPIDENEIIAEIDKLAKEIREEEEVKNKLDIGEGYLRTQLLLKLLTGSKAIETDMKSEYETLEVYYHDYKIALLDIDAKWDKLEEAADITAGYLKSYEQLEVIKINSQVICLIKDYNKKRESQLFHSIHNKLLTRHGIGSFITLSKSIQGIENMATSYRTVTELSKQRFLFPKNVILEESDYDYANPKQQEDKSSSCAEQLSEQLCILMQVGDEARIITELEGFKEQLKQTHTSTKKVISICTNILMKTLQFTSDKCKEYNMNMPKGEMIIERVYQSKDIDEVMSYMQCELLSLCHELENKAPENNMDKILYYINTNYGSELKLEKLAEIFSYNSSYLGKSFKTHTGESFNTYVDKVRINKAKELLLNQDMKVYEISKQVGYKHIDYFHSKFKKHVGISPLEFKKGKDEIRND